MGSGASVSMASQQEALDEKVAGLLTLKWDRVHLRCHYATTEGERKIDPQISFSVIGGDGEDSKNPVIPIILEDKNSPATCTWLLEDHTNHPIWNETELLLYLRSNVDSEKEVTRRLKVQLQDYRTLRDKIGDTMDSIKHGVGAGLRKVSKAITKEDKTYSPTMDNMEGKESMDPMTEESMKNAAMGSSESLEEDGTLVDSEDKPQLEKSPVPTPRDPGGNAVHRPPEVLVDCDIDLPQPYEGWVNKQVKTEHATVYFSVRTSLGENMTIKVNALVYTVISTLKHS